MLSKSYRGKKTLVSEESFNNCHFEGDGTISFHQNGYGYGDGKKSKYSVTINANDFLGHAKNILNQAGRNAAVEYRIAVVVDNKVVKWL